MSNPVVTILRKKTYLAMIRNAVRGEVHMFRNLFAMVDGVERDILDDGQLSCAAFVSGILTLNNLLPRPHATVSGLEKGMAANGWVEIPDLREGAVISWEPITYDDGQLHGHIGFYIGKDQAISNASNNAGFPKEHHVTSDGTRKVIHIWWHPMLDEA